MKTMVINCFNFTLGTTAIIDGRERVRIDNNSQSIFSTARNHGVEKIVLIGPHAITQKIKEDLIHKYSFLQVKIIPN